MMIWYIYTHCVTQSSSWYLVALTVERVICITMPHKVKLSCTVRRARYWVLLIILALLSINTICYTVIVKGVYIPDRGTMVFSRFPNSYELFLGIEIFVTFIAPVCILVPSSVIMSLALFRNKMQVTAQAKSRAVSVTRNLIAANILFVLTLTPFRINSILEILWSVFYLDVYYIGQYLSELNSVLNFYIYFISGSRFRSDLKAILCRTGVKPN